MKKCGQALGRKEGDTNPTSQILYPCMQCADIFYLKADICQLGKDQRKVNMLAREYCDKNKKYKKPIIVSHHMLSGMTPPDLSKVDENADQHEKDVASKMSKSNPNSAIFMEDTEAMIAKKISKAYCTPATDKDENGNKNPILDYCESIIFPAKGAFLVERPENNGGNVVYKNYEELRSDYMEAKLHPGDLKPSVARVINELVEPVRRHFREDAYARSLLEQITKWQAEAANEKKDK
jgi:tyrosyl-tRNA synthetase